MEKIDFVDDEDFFTDDEAAIACKDAFGIKYMFPWQRLVVANILDAYNATNESNDVTNESSGEVEDFLSHQIVLLPTGAGKSLCFQVPALLLPGPTLIVYPLLALMSDQERRMNEGSLKSVVFRGGQTEEERKENFRKLKDENYKIIIANPEVLESNSLLEELCKCNICHIAIDEAHTVWEWGSSFRKSYLNLGKVIKKLSAPVVTAFTATASPEVLEQVSNVLFDGEAHIVRSESDRPNIHYYVYKASSKEKAALYLAKTERRPMILFCGTRNHAEKMCRLVNMAYGEGTSRFYHAGLEKEEKTEVEKWFFSAKDAVLCATCAFGMGVDKSDIRTVVHVDPPATAESYIQEAGRGGRDREVADAILLWNYSDEEKTSSFDEKSRFRAVRNFALSTTCRRQVLLDALGAEEAVCSGCDICDRKNREATRTANLMPGETLPNDTEVLLKIVRRYDRYFTEEELEKEYLEKMNSLTLKKIGVNIWTHGDFVVAKEELVKKGKIKVFGFPWKGRVGIARRALSGDRQSNRFVPNEPSTCGTET